MGTSVCGHAGLRSSTTTRLLLVGVVLTAALWLTSQAQAAVTASVARGTLTVTGSAPGERIALRLASGGRLVVDVGDNGSANFTFLRNRFTRIAVKGGLGNDRLRIDESRGAFTSTERTTLNGGPGADTLIGGRFAETLNGFTGIDTVEGNAGADTAVLGAGADLFVWDPGDGNDVVQGGSELDTHALQRLRRGRDLRRRGLRLRAEADAQPRSCCHAVAGRRDRGAECARRRGLRDRQ